MRWKPAILFLLVAVLFIGGAVFYWNLQKITPPDFKELDAFLRHSTPSADWRLDSAIVDLSYDGERPGWWDGVGIHFKITISQDHCTFFNESTKDQVFILLLRENRKLKEIDFSGDPVSAAAFRELAFRKFPHLRAYDISTIP